VECKFATQTRHQYMRHLTGMSCGDMRVGSSSTVGPTAPTGTKAPQFNKIVPNTILGRI
jgi:hypothetical protein